MRANRRAGRTCYIEDLFQLPPTHEGERRGKMGRLDMSYFNSRPRMRANVGHPRGGLAGCDFNSRPRMRANVAPRTLICLGGIFQLPPSHEGELYP